MRRITIGNVIRIKTARAQTSGGGGGGWALLSVLLLSFISVSFSLLCELPRKKGYFDCRRIAFNRRKTVISGTYPRRRNGSSVCTIHASATAVSALQQEKTCKCMEIARGIDPI